MTGRPLRVVVCGTTFGQVYLRALHDAGGDLALAGVLARGSERSRAFADHYGVPLYTAPGEVPGDVDAACVVVRSGLLGGSGTDLALELMARGVAVLQEHPVHHDELASCLRAARRHGVAYLLNTFYPDVPTVASYVAAARALLRHQPPLYVDAAGGFQVAYALLDVLGSVLGGVRPWGFSTVAAGGAWRQRARHEPPLRSLDGVLRGVPVTLRLHHQLQADDPDAGAHLLQRVTVGVAGGSLTLADAHGPVVWNARPAIPSRAAALPPDQPPVAALPAACRDEPSAQLLGPPRAPSPREVYGTLWPAGVRRTLRRFRRMVLGGDDPLPAGQYHLALCQVWQDVSALLGPPALVDLPPLEPLGAAALADVAAALQTPG